MNASAPSIKEVAFRFAYERWKIKPNRSLLDHAELCMKYEGQRAADIALDMGWIDKDAHAKAIKILNGNANHLREVETLVTINPGLERNRQRLLAIAENLIWLDSLTEEGICLHPDLEDELVLSACEKHSSILMQISGMPVLVFYERETGMRRFQQISGVERASDPIRKKNPDMIFGLARNDEVIALLDKKSRGLMVSDGAQGSDQDFRDTIIYESQLIQESEPMRKLAVMHDMALTHAASDIHMWVNAEGKVFVAYRVLGDLAPMPVKLTSAEYTPILNFLLRRSGASIKFEKMRAPKDGMYQWIGSGAAKKANVRCSFIPNGHSDTPGLMQVSICLRLIPEESGSVVLESKGIRPDVVNYLKRSVIPDSGIVLLVGPTGSGKSTTIAGTIDLHRKLHGDTKVRLSIEDPVERHYPGIEQFQVPYALRGTSEGFSLFLRNFLRHDPNLIWIGEIRDEITAKIAIQAASTGHLVISTLHAETTSKTVQRLSDMIPAEDRSMKAALIENLSLIVAQRLTKKLCPHCSVWEAPTQREREHIEYVNEMKGLTLVAPERAKVKCANGCKNCNYTGYEGRLPVNEVLEFTEEVKLIFRDPDPIQQGIKIKKAIRLKMEDCIMDAVNDGATALSSLEI